MNNNPYLDAPPEFWPIPKLHAEIERLQGIIRRKDRMLPASADDELRGHCRQSIWLAREAVEHRRVNDD